APDHAAYRLDLAGALNNVGAYFWDAGRLADAEQHWRRALAVAEPLGAKFPNRPAVAATLATARCQFGAVFVATRPPGQAQPRARVVGAAAEAGGGLPPKADPPGRPGRQPPHPGRPAGNRRPARRRRAVVSAGGGAAGRSGGAPARRVGLPARPGR